MLNLVRQVIQMGRVKRIWYLTPMRAAKVQASLRIRAVSPEPPLLAHTSSESRGTFRQKARPLALLNVWACAVKVCHDGMFEDTNSLDAAQIIFIYTILMLINLSRKGKVVCRNQDSSSMTVVALDQNVKTYPTTQCKFLLILKMGVSVSIGASWVQCTKLC